MDTQLIIKTLRSYIDTTKSIEKIKFVQDLIDPQMLLCESEGAKLTGSLAFRELNLNMVPGGL